MAMATCKERKCLQYYSGRIPFNTIWPVFSTNSKFSCFPSLYYGKFVWPSGKIAKDKFSHINQLFTYEQACYSRNSSGFTVEQNHLYNNFLVTLRQTKCI